MVVREYTGSQNFSHLIRGSLSSCGNFIFIGSDDGVVHVWDSDTGMYEICTIYILLSFYTDNKCENIIIHSSSFNQVIIHLSFTLLLKRRRKK